MQKIPFNIRTRRGNSPVKKNEMAPLAYTMVVYCDCGVPVSEVPGRQHLRSTRCHGLSVPRVCRIALLGPVHFLSPDDQQYGMHCLIIYTIEFRRDLKAYLFAGHVRRWRIRGVT